jgi:hypothetical protein
VSVCARLEAVADCPVERRTGAIVNLPDLMITKSPYTVFRVLGNGLRNPGSASSSRFHHPFVRLG